jgi:hypothetical protein
MPTLPMYEFWLDVWSAYQLPKILSDSVFPGIIRVNISIHSVIGDNLSYKLSTIEGAPITQLKNITK